MKNKNLFIGIGIFVVLIISIIVIKNINIKSDANKKLDTVYVATGGGKEDFLADEDVLKILKKILGSCSNTDPVAFFNSKASVRNKELTVPEKTNT